MSSLAHHGVKGQKWGVRRFQNPDGTRTALGKKQLKAIRLSRNEEGIRQVYRSLSDRDLNLLGYEKEEIEANRKDDFKDLGRRHTDYDQYNRVRYKNGDAVGYIAATGYQTAVGRGKKIVNILAIDLAVNSNYRGQGHSVELGKDIVRWFDRYGSKEYDRMEWYAKAENIASQKAAERSGFERRSKKESAQGWVKYSYKGKKVKHSSIGGNMNYIYGNTLVLGDSSYLEHHGIKNQKWGIRRFQNPDGSLTAAGRIRYGVTGAAKAAFKVGKKLGAATASAARAGVKKAKDNAYEKKKEKASQTREGVLKNKKMFTNEELERLEKRFKIEDDMRNAGLRHGQEIAKTISAYSDAAVKTMNALQTGGKAVKAISDGLSALQDYKEKRDIGKKASDAGMSTADYKEYTKAKTSEKTSNKPPNDDNPPNDGGGGGLGAKKAAATNGPKEQTKYDYSRSQAQDELNAKQKADLDKRKADLDKRKADLDKQEEYIKAHQDALVKVSKQRQSEQDARDEDLNRRDKAASEREERLKSAAKGAVEVFNKLNERKANLDRREADLNKIADALDSEIGYRIDTLSELRKTSQDNNDDDNPKKKKNVKHSVIGEEMHTDYLEHHGIKGQRWGVRRFQNADGSLTDKGRKHYQKKLALEERKLTAANAARGRYERVRTPMSVGMGVIGAVAGAMAGVPAGPAGIAAGAAFVSSIAASSTYAEYTVKGVFAGHGANRSKKKIAKYKEALAQDAFEIQNGVLIYGSGQSGELEHFGLKGMKWGIRRFQNPDGTRTEAGKKRDAKIAAKAAKYRNKDISRYDVEIAKAKDPDQKYRYEQLRKHTEKLSDREIIAQQRYSRAVAAGEGIVATVGVSLGLGIPNIGSIAIGAAVARSIAKTTRDNYRVRSINAERTQESVRREYEDLINHSAFVEDGTLYLSHHGILGQKWGVRRFQDVAGRLTAAGKQHIQEAKKKLGNAGAKYKPSNVETQQTDVVPGGGAAEDWDDFDDESLNYYIDYLLSLSDDQLSALGFKRSDLEKATSRDDKYKIVLALKKIDSTSPKVVRVLNSMLTALFSSDLTKTLEPAKLTGDVLFAKMREHAAAKRRESEEIDPKTGFHVKNDKNSSMETDVRNVNPGFTNLSDNTKNNCMLCTTAYDLRRRGYDVNAERISSGLQTTDVKRYYPDAEVRQVTGATTTAELNQKTKEALISQGEGARGNLMVTWQGGAGGHSMAYEVHNGEVKIYDGQSGEVHETEEIIAYTTAVSYARLDNVEPDWDRIKEAVR